jgi:hypothetical protein
MRLHGGAALVLSDFNPDMERMKRYFNRRVRRWIFGIGSVAVVAAAALIGSGQRGQAEARTWSQSTGDVTVDTVPDERGVWFSDANIVALIREMNAPVMDAARIQLGNWDDAAAAEIARQILTEHATGLATLDSVAQTMSIGVARPAIADSAVAPYAQQVLALNGLPISQLSRTYLATQIAAHRRAEQDLESLAAATLSPDLQSVVLTRLVPMERAHRALLERRQAMVVQADSVARDSTAARRSR